jgi:hypothetical protein
MAAYRPAAMDAVTGPRAGGVSLFEMALEGKLDELPQWLLERLAAGELPQADARRVWARLLARGEGWRLAELERSNRELLAAHPPARVAAEVHRRLGRRRPRLVLLPVLAVGMAAALVAAPRPEVTREKGVLSPARPRVAVYRRSDSPQRPLPPSSQVRAGDVVQVEYAAAGRRYGVVASVDGRGEVTLHLPEQPGPAAPLDPAGAHPAPSALELDDSPGFERFVFVASDVPFPTSLVVRALRDGQPLRGLDVAEIVLQKGTP